MKLFLRLIHISFLLILVVLVGCPTTEEINKTDPDTLLNQGIKHRNKYEYDKAISNFTKAIEINPSAEAYYRRGDTYVGKGHVDKAISEFNKAIEVNPEYPGAYVLRGFLYSWKGQSDKAKADLNRAMVKFYERAISYQLKGQYKKACIDYGNACWLDSKAACGEFDMLEEKGFCQHQRWTSIMKSNRFMQ